jgi:hypothetical protein
LAIGCTEVAQRQPGSKYGAADRGAADLEQFHAAFWELAHLVWRAPKFLSSPF